jgi:hypothetical protein
MAPHRRALLRRAARVQSLQHALLCGVVRRYAA